MFTGIVETTGEIRHVAAEAGGRRLAIYCPLDGLTRGDSISVNGVCLTAETCSDDTIEVFLSQETLDRTYLDELEKTDPVNLERPLPADGRFDGHIVQGHVDGTATVAEIEPVGDDYVFAFSLPADLAPYLVEKGSITVDGISLTVAELSGDRFTTAIIPETYDRTNLSAKTVGDPVHLEVDVVAKYVERLTEQS